MVPSVSIVESTAQLTKRYAPVSAKSFQSAYVGACHSGPIIRLGGRPGSPDSFATKCGIENGVSGSIYIAVSAPAESRLLVSRIDIYSLCSKRKKVRGMYGGRPITLVQSKVRER